MSQDIIRVVLVDDIADTRDNMKKLLLFEEDIEVIGSARRPSSSSIRPTSPTSARSARC